MSDPTSSAPLSVLIVGAGPVGLTMAAHLRAHGLAPRLIDKAPHPSETSKALVLWPRSLEMLDDLRIVDRFLADGRPPNEMRLYGNGHLLLEFALGSGVEGTAYPKPLVLPQSETERLLTEHLRDADLAVERPVELVRFADRDDGVDATLRHADGREEDVRSDYLLGCDGAHSTVRHGLGLEFTGKAEPSDFLLADCRVGGLPDEAISLFWHPKGVLAFFPFGDGRCRIIADIGAPQGDGKPRDPSPEELQAIVDARGPGGVRLSDPRWLAGFRINERKVADYRKGRCFLAGDAAHIHSPAGGQGMNTGMQDTWNLAWKLALVQSGRAKASLLDSYTPERGAVGELVLRNATLMTRVVTIHNPVAQFLRNRIVAALGHLPAFHRAFFGNLTELKIHYPDSPLNGESSAVPWATGGLKPGDRVPDGTLRSPATGEDHRLHVLLRGPQHGLLLLPDDQSHIAELAEIGRRAEATYPGVIRSHVIASGAAPSGAAPDWLDPESSLRRILGARPSALAVVRPDGYLGYRGQPASWDELRSYLDRYLITAPAASSA
ncbi:MAG TPA: FAD-dependent monooxygenase [Isosphaeraceae bacterium]